jgi:hypothetical protein
MTYGLRLLGVGVLMAMGALAVAQQRPPSERPRRASTKAPLDARVLASIRQITAATTRPKIEKLASFGTRHTLSVHHPELAQKGRGIVAAREWIKAEFERYSQECGGCLEVAFDTFMQEPRDRVPKPTEVANVYAVLRGTDPAQTNRVFLVTGHYDSRASDPLDPTSDAPGANDDASGTVVSMEAARALSKHKFPASIIFLAVAGEEQGLLGARHFAQLAQEKGWKIEGVLNNDIVGGNKGPGQDPDVVRVFSEGIPVTAKEADIRRIMATGGESDSPSRQLARYVEEFEEVIGAVDAKTVFRRDRYLRGGDHSAFNEFGVPAVRFTEYREDYNHQHNDPRTENGIEYGDLPKFVDFDYVARVARLNATMLALLASAPPPPRNVRLLTKQLENDSTLAWEAAPGAARYELLWRPTTAAEWENAEDVGNVTQYTSKRSKDNVVFAVRSVGKSGARSLPAVPTPER